MKKKIFAFIFALKLCVVPVLPAFAETVPVFAEMATVPAADSAPRLVDNADLLTDSEEAGLLSELDGISRQQHADVVVVTADSLDGKSPMEYADDFYDHNGYAEDGVLLLVSMEERDWWISTSGFGITAITDAGLDHISGKFLPALSDGDYAKAFSVYARLCGDFLEQARTGEPYDAGRLPKAPFNAVKSLLAALSAGFVAALAITGVMAGKLKTVRFQPEARNYVRRGSFQVTKSHDLFLYRHIDRHKKAEKNSTGGPATHSSSSGSTHGGGGGKF